MAEYIRIFAAKNRIVCLPRKSILISFDNYFIVLSKRYSLTAKSKLFVFRLKLAVNLLVVMSFADTLWSQANSVFLMLSNIFSSFFAASMYPCHTYDRQTADFIQIFNIHTDTNRLLLAIFLYLSRFSAKRKMQRKKTESNKTNKVHCKV